MKRKFKKVLSLCMALALAFGLVPLGSTSANAATDSGLHLSKSIELQESGNYKITLEAYATGQDTTTSVEKAVPLDIVLVLDQSGSMADGFGDAVSKRDETNRTLGQTAGYFVTNRGGSWYPVRWNGTTWQYKNGWGWWKSVDDSNLIYISRLAALKNSVTNFVTTVENKAVADNVDHRIAIVGFASESDYGDNTEVLSVSGSNSGSVGVKYDAKNGNSYTTALANAFQDTTTENGKIMLTNAINALAANGATQADLGMKMAQQILEKDVKKDEAGRKKLVIMFTDGSPTSFDGFETDVAKSAISYAKTIKKSAKVYSIGIFNGANTAIPTDSSSNENKFMHYVSSNYPEATSMDDTGKVGSKTGYYKAAANADELSSIFESISESETTSGTTVTLDSSSVMRDIVSTNFEIADGVQADTVKVYTADSDTVSADGTITWKNRVESPGITATISGKTVDVTGFDYSANYVTAAHSGKKLIVEIYVNALATGNALYSNDEKSGIYDKSGTDGKLVQAFERPTVAIDRFTYVLDYGKPVTLPNTDFGVKGITKINSTKAAPSTDTNIKKNYGTYSLASSSLKYTPTNMIWDGMDSVFAFGQKSDTSGYKWVGVDVIPANNVYYEDDFVTTDTGNAGIVYTGSWSPEEFGNKGETEQSADNTNYGWDISYEGETGFSGGSAHKGDGSKGASAEFTFKGTGVDIYSRTNKKTGKVMAIIYKKQANAEAENGYEFVSKKILNVDNFAASGDYYQIPTLSFDMEEYGEYKVVLYVGNGSVAGVDEGRFIYYLDGIRVYNPLGTPANGSIAAEKYEEAGENDTKIIGLREVLLDAGTDTEKLSEGAVFIDQIPDMNSSNTGVLSDIIGIYKEYGPKNEVYLASDVSGNGNAIATTIKGFDGKKVRIGMKSPSGKNAKVKVTFGNETKEYQINSTSDMYFDVTPNVDGNIVIQNVTEKDDVIVSLTKLRIPQVASAKSIALEATDKTVKYVEEFLSKRTIGASSNSTSMLSVDAEMLTANDVVVANPDEVAETTTTDKTDEEWNSIEQSASAYLDKQ